MAGPALHVAKVRRAVVRRNDPFVESYALWSSLRFVRNRTTSKRVLSVYRPYTLEGVMQRAPGSFLGLISKTLRANYDEIT